MRTIRHERGNSLRAAGQDLGVHDLKFGDTIFAKPVDFVFLMLYYFALLKLSFSMSFIPMISL
jgi:hypothetical protein